MTATTITQPQPRTRELDCREGDGMTILLMWDSVTSRVWVEIHDVRADRIFVTDVSTGDKPRDVFLHPFAYSTRVVGS